MARTERVFSNKMFNSYKDSVLHYADDQGQLDGDVVIQLLEEHSTDLNTFYEDGFPVKDSTDAEALLDWLGY